MKSLIPLTLVGVLLMSAATVNTWRKWLPDYITAWLDEEGSDDDQHRQLLLSPEAAKWHETPTVAASSFNLDWPFASLTPTSDASREATALFSSVLLQNPTGLLPLKRGKGVRVISTATGESPIYFNSLIRAFAPVVPIEYRREQDQMLLPLTDPNTPLVVITEETDVGIESPWFTALLELPANIPVALIYFGSEAKLDLELPSHWSVILTPERNKESESVLAQALFGATSIYGKLLEPAAGYPAGSGLRLNADHFGFANPESVGMDRLVLEQVDGIINYGIRRRAMPGAQLVVAKDGKIVYQKSYGHHTYRKRETVQSSDLFDLASITKTAVTSLAIMKLYDDQLIALDKKVADYLPQYAKRPVGRYTITQLLTHQTGIQANLPLYKYLGKQFVTEEAGREGFTIPIGPNRWLKASVPAQIQEDLKRVNYTKHVIYRYSDVNYYLLQLIVESITSQPLDVYVREQIYTPLGLQRISFNPLDFFPAEQLVPTVQDGWMRGALLRGYPHDEGAALLGGVGGHAGLFSSATELAMLYQLLLNGGSLNGVKIFSQATVHKFIERSPYNYRALGFDRLAGGWSNIIDAGASQSTFGHTGYSGTCVWADPENNLTFVLLTNRVHPNPNNKRFMKMGIRGKVHAQIYRSLEGLKAQQRFVGRP